MLIDVSDIKKSSGSSKDIVINKPLELDQIELSAPVEVRLKLTNVNSRILIKGIIKADVALKCSRCNEGFFWSNQVSIDEEFLESSSAEVVSKKDLDLKDLNIFVYKNDLIDLKEVIRQNVITNLPLNPICKTDCLGLCPVCGVNKNKEKCNCLADKPNVRQKLKIRQKSKKKGVKYNG